jgi:hypothetical protein
VPLLLRGVTVSTINRFRGLPMDLIVIAVVVGFFVLSAGLAGLLERL